MRKMEIFQMAIFRKSSSVTNITVTKGTVIFVRLYQMLFYIEYKSLKSMS